ncbi:ribosome silencing factor [Acholeplasma hippikon]|uniref:Ribosome-associated protein n=1 Tax=Acholeplasma hippikon TaxID=264636 RepID=A0A449BJT7_9MOLU|nr:ribosome silencing factor [Acholeplasma hippikon]VEU82587.1 ribosome-associated protein [Acholeplasma hippikon]
MDLLKKSIELLEKVNGKDIAVYEFLEKSPYYDYFVVATVNERAGQAAIGYFGKELKENLRAIEGNKGNTGWTLIDLGDVVVHLFTEKDREFYGFDKRFMELRKEIK